MKYLTFFLLIILSAIRAKAQNNAPINVSDYNKMSRILPPPPNAASLGKYGGLNTNLSSGGANFNIPLPGYSSKSINVPISLTYGSNGVKVDEIASRVGIGWVLNCGGVITRTAYGNIDDMAVGAPSPNLIPSATLLNWLDVMANPVNVNTYSQPDIFRFNFDGYSGKFILDTAYNIIKIQGNPILLTYSALKIQTGGDGNQFKITTPEGVQYFFGSSTSTEYSYSYPAGTGCGMPYNNYSAGSAFYLSKIVHPDNDTVNFVYTPIKYNYKTSASETIYSTWHGTLPWCTTTGASASSPQKPDNTACVNWLETRGVLLQEVNSTKFGKVTFNYITRDDYNDRLVSSLQYFKPGVSTAYKTITFNYQYSYSGSAFANAYTTDSLSRRPFLKNVIESSADGSLTKKHSFNYNDINSLPPRLSFAQDGAGFFNGKSNSTLIPLPTDPSYMQELPQATANRSVDPNYSLKGLLTSVMYPTGGKDSIVYESNKGVQAFPTPLQNATITATAYSQYLSGGSQINSSGIAVISTIQQATLTASCSSPTAGETNFKTTNVYFTNETLGQVILNQTLQYNQSLSQTFVLNSNYSYKLKVTVTGENTTGTASLAYQLGVATMQWQNVNLAGARVAKIITTDNVTNLSNIKKYIYGPGSQLYSEEYQKMLKIRLQCGSPSLNYECAPGVYDFYTMRSNPIYSLNDPFPVMYASVTESFGENYENGGIEHQFTNPDFPENQDFPAGNAFGDMIPNPPVTSFDFRRGRELYQGVFKKVGNNVVFSKKTFYHFKEDPRVDHAVSAFLVNKNFTNNSAGICSPVDIAFNNSQYNLLTYAVYQKWVYTDTVKTWTYDGLGQNYTEEKTITEYDNPANPLPTKITSFTSDLMTKIQTNFYPGDLTLTGDAEAARQQLIAKNISPALQQKVTQNNVQQFLLNTEYKIFPNGLVLPKRKIVQIANNPAEARIEIANYDNKGNILETSQTNGPSITYLWGYNQQYPVAEIKNATYQDVVSAIGQTALDQLNTNPGTDVQVRNLLNTLKTALPNTLITTYTYDPLVGMTSSTDPKGQTTYYEYDSFQRLVNIKDQYGNIVKHTDYHYQNQ